MADELGTKQSLTLLQFRGCRRRVKEKSTDFDPVEGEEGQVEVMARKRE